MQLRNTSQAHAYLFGSRYLRELAHCAVIVAHPDDEVVGAGSLIHKLNDVTIVHASNGAPRAAKILEKSEFLTPKDYGEARIKACACALAIAKIPAERIIEFGYMALDLPHRLMSLTRSVMAFLLNSSSEIVLTNAYDGGHPDHDATAFATHTAIDLIKRSGLKPPVIFEFGLYPDADSRTRVLDFLPGSGKETTIVVLDGKARKLKLQMFDCLSTQGGPLNASPFESEKFRRAPSYDFRRLPGCGAPHYESFDWGFSGDDWQDLACAALDQLFPKAEQSSRLDA